MQKTLAGLGGDVPFCNVYIDNVIMFSSSIQEHVGHLRQVFDRLMKIGLKLHPQKCWFTCPEVLYLGHIISAKGISPNQEKVHAVQEFRAAVNAKGVREFFWYHWILSEICSKFFKGGKTVALSDEAGCSISLEDPMSTGICEAQGAS